MVLFCFNDLNSLPLVRTCYTPPENRIDMALGTEFVYIDNMNRKDNYSLNLGLPGSTSIGFDFSLIHYNSSDVGANNTGDILFNLWHFTGDFFDGAVSSGFEVVFRIPTGADAYVDEKSRNLSFGNNELKITPVLSFNISNHEVLTFNLSYTFREGYDEDMYGPLKFNLRKSETYKSVFGLNPFYDESFFDSENLKNDYAAIAVGIITSKLYPWVFFGEIYYSSGFYPDDEYLSDICIEGDRVNPLLVSIGTKYFFTDSFYLLISGMLNVLREDGYIKNTMELSLNIFF